jgi:hypothetical protein
MSTYETGSPADQSAGSGGMKERAVDAAAEVDAGAMHVAGVAGEEAGSVAHDAKRAARGFFDETRVQLSEQASSQQRRAAGALRSTADELEGLASGSSSGSGGMATSAVRTIGQQTQRAADWLEQREPADLVHEVRGFARRHTGAFLAIAVGVGLVAGRVTRALVSEARGNGTGNGSGSAGAGSVTGGAAGWSDGTVGGASAGTVYPQSGAAGSMGTAGMGATGAMGAGQPADTPIADALTSDQGTGDPLGAGTESTDFGGAGTRDASTDEWSSSDEARR